MTIYNYYIFGEKSPMRTFLLFSLIVFSCQSPKEKTQDKPTEPSAGIQDVFLGEDTSKYSDRTVRRDGLITSKNAKLSIIKLNNRIADDCSGGCDRVVAYSFNGKIMSIEIGAIWLPDILSVFKNKYGEPSSSIGSYIWDKKAYRITIQPTDGHIDGHELHSVNIVDKALYLAYEKSIQADI